jgi:hypothetical protein
MAMIANLTTECFLRPQLQRIGDKPNGNKTKYY